MEEEGRLNEEKERDVKTVEPQYQTELNRNLGDLTHELIQRIVAQVSSGGGIGAEEAAGATAPVTVPNAQGAPDATAPTEAASEPEVETAAPEDEEEDDDVSFDDPYIDTPLCTTCNECTNINSRMFAYNENKQATIKDVTAGTYAELVQAAEKCPVHIIHPGKPKNPDEPGLDKLIERGAQFN